MTLATRRPAAATPTTPPRATTGTFAPTPIGGRAAPVMARPPVPVRPAPPGFACSRESVTQADRDPESQQQHARDDQHGSQGRNEVRIDQEHEPGDELGWARHLLAVPREHE